MPPKFYVVKEGRAPGIYSTWDSCLDQVKGYPKAVFKSFPTLSEAQTFLQGGVPSHPAPKRKIKYYAVRSGHVPGVYTDWESAEAQIRGSAAPRYKAFPTYSEAEAFVNGQDNPKPASPAPGSSAAKRTKPAASSTSTSTSASPAPVSAASDDARQPPAKRRKKDTPPPNPDDDDDCYSPGEGPLPPGATDGFDPRIKMNPYTGTIEYKTPTELRALKWQATTPTPSTPLKIYTDGSSLGNGALGAVAGVGVFFGPHDARNVSEPLQGTRQTNQRAELTALQRALEIAPKNRQVVIYTDSNYAIKCVTEWFQAWRRNGWVNAAKKPVENKDLVEKVLGLLEERARIAQGTRRGGEGMEGEGQRGRPKNNVEFVWVKGHGTNEGNIAADELAVAGAREARQMMQAERNGQ